MNDRYAKGTPIFKMFQEFWVLIKSFDDCKSEEDMEKVKYDCEEWVLTVTKGEAQIMAYCLASGFISFLGYKYRITTGEMPEKCVVYRTKSGRLAIRGSNMD